MYTGHTHNDNDQAHGRIAQGLKHFSALTISDLTALIQKTFIPNFPEHANRTVLCRTTLITMLSEVADWKHFLKDMARKESTVGS